MGSRESPLVTKPPRRLRSTRWANSRPYPNVPLAARIGFRRRNAPIFTLRSTAPAELTSPERIARSRYTQAKCGERAADRFRPSLTSLHGQVHTLTAGPPKIKTQSITLTSINHVHSELLSSPC